MKSNLLVSEINNISEYMHTIKSYQLDSCISRGEDTKYPSLSAAAFRRNSSLDIQSMVNEFQSYIGNMLTEMQNKHFLAFSQHYGLPTNLLDFTHSPLISLYFACLGDTETAGFVYFIKKNRLISLTKHLDLVNSVFFPKFLIASAELEDLYHGVSTVLGLNEIYAFEFLEQIDHMIGNAPGSEAIHHEIDKILSSANEFEIGKLDRLITILDRQVRLKGISTEIRLKDLGSYCHILIQLLNYLIFYLHRFAPFDFPFYFTYEPANITTRISNQSSIFIYQLYGINDMRQAINPDYILKISNKTDILNDLNNLGINEKFIFNDYDHIASYVKQKYLKLSDERDITLANLRN